MHTDGSSAVPRSADCFDRFECAQRMFLNLHELQNGLIGEIVFQIRTAHARNSAVVDDKTFQMEGTDGRVGFGNENGVMIQSPRCLATGLTVKVLFSLHELDQFYLQIVPVTYRDTQREVLAFSAENVVLHGLFYQIERTDTGSLGPYA